ncbi:unnamed protein product [Protopolystoma xenopodis]|uniref:Uncharacterized protein n=1 Tax=Protopolystoma xenopodis TaxID=117903 RepID=A0A448XNI7_9PLAT|nr:unnamed protein product [Protopolystoma xenopodis]
MREVEARPFNDQKVHLNKSGIHQRSHKVTKDAKFVEAEIALLKCIHPISCDKEGVDAPFSVSNSTRSEQIEAAKVIFDLASQAQKRTLSRLQAPSCVGLRDNVDDLIAYHTASKSVCEAPWPGLRANQMAAILTNPSWACRALPVEGATPRRLVSRRRGQQRHDSLTFVKTASLTRPEATTCRVLVSVCVCVCWRHVQAGIASHWHRTVGIRLSGAAAIKWPTSLVAGSWEDCSCCRVVDGVGGVDAVDAVGGVDAEEVDGVIVSVPVCAAWRRRVASAHLVVSSSAVSSACRPATRVEPGRKQARPHESAGRRRGDRIGAPTSLLAQAGLAVEDGTEIVLPGTEPRGE